MKKKTLFLSNSTATVVCNGSASVQALECFPPNEPLNLFKVRDVVSELFAESRKALLKAVRPNANSKWTQDKLESEFESFVKAISSHLTSPHSNLHEVYNCLNLMRSRLDLEIRTKHPIPECVTLKEFLDVICEKFIQENKGIDLLASMIFIDGESIRKNPLLRSARQRRLEEHLANKLD